MNKQKRRFRRTMAATVASLALFATACGGGGGQTSEEASAALIASETNTVQLQLTSDVASTQLLDTFDGSISSLGEEITGDRPVLVWYWAPH